MDFGDSHSRRHPSSAMRATGDDDDAAFSVRRWRLSVVKAPPCSKTSGRNFSTDSSHGRRRDVPLPGSNSKKQSSGVGQRTLLFRLPLPCTAAEHRSGPDVSGVLLRPADDHNIGGFGLFLRATSRAAAQNGRSAESSADSSGFQPPSRRSSKRTEDSGEYGIGRTELASFSSKQQASPTGYGVVSTATRTPQTAMDLGGGWGGASRQLRNRRATGDDDDAAFSVRRWRLSVVKAPPCSKTSGRNFSTDSSHGRRRDVPLPGSNSKKQSSGVGQRTLLFRLPLPCTAAEHRSGPDVSGVLLRPADDHNIGGFGLFLRATSRAAAQNGRSAESSADSSGFQPPSRRSSKRTEDSGEYGIGRTELASFSSKQQASPTHGHLFNGELGVGRGRNKPVGRERMECSSWG
nr:hypothetical protein Itr_chr05CG14060 [Ipomoea trifida]